MTNVLIVEDHVSMRESLTTALTAAGDFSVVGEVPNADYALDFCKHLHPELVLMDVCTEGGASGLKAVEAIRKTDSEVKIIVMTAFDEITYIPRARAAAPLRGRGAQGQIHGEGAGGQRDGGGQAAWLPALQEQRAAVESDDVPDDGQAHSRPLSGLREQVGGGPLQQSGELSVGQDSQRGGLPPGG